MTDTPSFDAGRQPHSGGDVTVWLRQMKDGNREGVRLLLEHYFRRLVRLAAARLRGRPGLADHDEDVALSAFTSLCLGAERGRFPRLANRQDLWRLLATLTVRKAIDLRRRRRPEQPAGADGFAAVRGKAPPPVLASEVADECARLLALLDGEPDLRAVVL